MSLPVREADGGSAARTGGRVHLRNTYLLIDSSDSHAGVAGARSASALKDDSIYLYLLTDLCSAVLVPPVSLPQAGDMTK